MHNNSKIIKEALQSQVLKNKLQKVRITRVLFNKHQHNSSQSLQVDVLRQSQFLHTAQQQTLEKSSLSKVIYNHLR